MPINKREWLGLLLGLLGVIVVLYGTSTWSGTISVKGILWLSFSLLGIVAGTLIQKRYAQHVDLVTGSTYQVECCFIIFSILLLLFMIRHGKATKVASYF